MKSVINGVLRRKDLIVEYFVVIGTVVVCMRLLSVVFEWAYRGAM